MAEFSTLEVLQAFHQELLAVREGRAPAAESLENGILVEAFESELERIWSKPPKSQQSRDAIKKGIVTTLSIYRPGGVFANLSGNKITLNGEDYTLNEQFQQATYAFADEVDLDETEAARFLLEAQDDVESLGRSLLECGIIRFHQQRKYALDALRLLLEMDRDGEEGDDESPNLEPVQIYVFERIFSSGRGPGPEKRLVPRCLAAMQTAKAWLQRLGDKIAAAQTLGQNGTGPMSEEAETVEFSRISLIQQHELLAVILCRAVEKRQADISDFKEFMSNLRRADKYDNILGWLPVEQVGPARRVLTLSSPSCTCSWCLHDSVRLN